MSPSSVVEPFRHNLPSLLAPALAVRAVSAVLAAREDGLPIGIFETWRSQARHAWLYAQGRTRPGVKVTNSPTSEISLHGWGLAIDFAFLSGDGGWFWPSDSDQRWQRAIQHFLAAGLSRGPAWDLPHIRPKNVPDVLPAELRQRYDSDLLDDRIAVWQHYDMLRIHYWDTRLPWEAR